MILNIEKLIYGGEGLARMPDGKAVFIPFVLPGEQVEAEPLAHKQKSGFARARLVDVKQPSPERVQPGCPYFGACGGCQYQHMSYERQLAAKADIFKETLRRTAKLESPAELQVHSAEPWKYRNRTRLHFVHAPQFAMGYYRFGSRQLLGVRECPISSTLINRAIELLWKLGEQGSVAASVREIEMFADDTDSKLMFEVHADGADVGRGEESQVYQTVEALWQSGLAAAIYAFPFGEDAPAWEWEGSEPFFYAVNERRFRVGPGAFFQVNRFLLPEFVRTVSEGESGTHALDLYAGGGLFAAFLAQSFEKVTAVESAPASFADLQSNSPKNVHTIGRETADFLQRGKFDRADVIVMDPPRSGLSSRVVEGIIKSGAPRLTYVSCDPATLARDLKLLAAGGYEIREQHLFDLFPQSFHIETVTKLSR